MTELAAVPAVEGADDGDGALVGGARVRELAQPRLRDPHRAEDRADVSMVRAYRALHDGQRTYIQSEGLSIQALLQCDIAHAREDRPDLLVPPPEQRLLQIEQPIVPLKRRRQIAFAPQPLSHLAASRGRRRLGRCRGWLGDTLAVVARILSWSSHLILP